MKKVKIKTEWASIYLLENNNLIVCAKNNGSSRCFRFESLEQLKHAIDKKRVIVKKWAIAVPQNMCFLRPLSLPASDLKEAMTMVEYELPLIMPLSMDEIVYSTTYLNKHENMLNVLVCIIKQKTLDEYLNLFKNIGIVSEKIVLSSLAIQNWINVSSQSKNKTVLGVIIDLPNCVILKSDEGSLEKANEYIIDDLDEPSTASEILHYIIQERDELEMPAKKDISYLLVGDDENTSSLKKLLCSVETEYDMADKIKVIKNPEYENYENHNQNEECPGLNTGIIVASGLLDLMLNSKLPDSNLVSPHFIKKNKQKALMHKYIFTASLALVFIVLVWLYFATINWRIAKLSKMIELEIAPIENTATIVDRKRQQVRAVQGQFSSRGRIAKIISELYDYTPNNISINSIEFDSKYNRCLVDIKGQADSLTTSFGYTEAVKNAKLIGGLQVEGGQRIPQAGGSIVVFTAFCEIRND